MLSPDFVRPTSSVLTALRAAKHGRPKVPVRKLSVLSQETERADDRRFLCLSLADGEKADDADNEQDGIADAAGYRNKKGPEEHRADDAEQDVNDRKLERLTDMEACIR